MRTRIFTLSATALIAVTAVPAAASGKTAAAATATSTSASAPAPASAKADKKICKWLRKSGTRMDAKVCLTKSEWKRVEKGDY